MTKSSTKHRTIDRLLPNPDFYEHHQRLIAAPPLTAWEALLGLTLAEMPLTRLLFRLRSVPERLTGRHGLPANDERPLLGQMLRSGFAMLAEVPEREMVFGAVAQPWIGAEGKAIRVEDAAAFAAFDGPGFVKMTMDFVFEEVEAGTLLSTETRVLATDPRSRRAFRAYWIVIRAGSGAIRRDWLRAAAHRAERAVAASA